MSRPFLLICVTDVVSDVEARVYLFARIENVLGVKDMFASLEDFEHLLGVHEMQVW